MSLTVEFGVKKLQESGLTEKGVMEPGGDKPDGGPPFERLDAVGYRDLHHDVSAKKWLRTSRKGDRTLLGLRKINPQSYCHRLAENGVIGTRIQQTVSQLRRDETAQQYRKDWPVANL
jgi:hypothetical protein